ncbi:MAG: efflux RND transporter periplasmic adaptor subunit [Verrucomicrobia bacterium]|nr:MAG: efflux RND transporter periplasmic adaptor subunit [Verrucomicrobiota bacterium]
MFDCKKGRNFAACRRVQMKLHTELSDFKTLNHGSSHRSPQPQAKRARTANQRIPKWAYLLFILLAGFVTYRILQHRATEVTATQPAPRPATVAKVITKDVPLYLDEIGTCAAYETVQVQAQVSGVIMERHFQDGSDVKKGDLLFTIDPRPYKAALDQAKAQAALDQVTLKRQEDLRARKVIAQQDYDIALANAQKSQAATEAAQVNYDYCFIKSPIIGRIGLRNVDVGNLVGPSTGALVTIQGLDPIYTDFTVAENDLPLVRKYLGGPNVKVETYLADGSITPRTGDLYFIDNAVQPGSGTVKARGVMPNPDRALWPSEFVRVRFILDTLKDATLVPSQAVQVSQSGPFVFVVKADNTVELRPVTPGQRQHGDLTVIESGVKPDETVVVTGQLALAPGSKIAPQPYAPKTPATPDGAAGSKSAMSNE